MAPKAKILRNENAAAMATIRCNQCSCGRAYVCCASCSIRNVQRRYVIRNAEARQQHTIKLLRAQLSYSTVALTDSASRNMFLKIFENLKGLF